MFFFPVDLVWRTSSWSAGSNCVEVAGDQSIILIRDTQDRSRALLSFPPAAWTDFVSTVQGGSVNFL